MGNCFGGSSRKAVIQSNELTTRATSTGRAVREARDDVQIGTHKPSAIVVSFRSPGVEEVDGVPIHVPDSVEGPSTPFNTPAAPSVLLDCAFDPNTLGQKVASRLFLDTSRLARINYVPADQWSKCAYCNHPTGDRYDYFLCSSMSLGLLDTLMENGWWRTGEVLFKPCFPVVCCPGYALRMPIAEFTVRKQHRRVVRKWANFLRNGDSRWDNRIRNNCHTTLQTSSPKPEEEQNGHLPTENESALARTAVASAGVEKVVGNGDFDSHATTDEEAMRESSSRDSTVDELSDVSQSFSQQRKRERRVVTPGRGADPSKPPCRKAKQMREERKQKRLEAHRGNDSSFTSQNKSPPPQPMPSLHQLLADHREAVHGYEAGFKHKLEVRLLGCNPRNPELMRTLNKAYELYSKFQEVVHPGKTRFKSASDFKWGFMNSPIQNPPTHLEGSYHMHYYLDDELVMISILDILPKHFVSIYFIYDPDIRFMTPGIYTVLVEVDLVQQLSKQRPGLEYYALGYYNPNPKVSYKGQFKPQQILCNETNVFVPMESAMPKLMLKPYVQLAGEEVPEKEGRTASIDNLIVNSRYTGLGPVPYQILDHRIKKKYERPLRELIAETGSEAAHQFVITVPNL